MSSAPAVRRVIKHNASTLRIELDSSEIDVNDPGNGTPALVCLGEDAGTFWCVADTGEIGYRQLTRKQIDWLRSHFYTVNSFIEKHSPAQQEIF